MGLYEVICITEHTGGVDVKGLHKVVSVNSVLLARTANKDELWYNVTEIVTDDKIQQESTLDVGGERGYIQESCDLEMET